MHCEQFLTEATEAMPDDLGVASSQQGQRFIPCNALACSGCGASVMHVDHLAHQLGRGAALTAEVDSRDPLAFFRVSHVDRASRLYACRCHALNVDWLTDTGRLDLHDIDRWGCSGHPPPAGHARVRALAEVLPDATRLHLRQGGWLLLGDSALHGQEAGRVVRWPFDANEATPLDDAQLEPLIARLVAQRPRWTARQVAPPRFATGHLFAMFLEGWKHGDLDSQQFEGTFADAAELVTKLRARATTLPPPDSIEYRLSAGLLTSAGYEAFVDHLA